LAQARDSKYKLSTTRTRTTVKVNDESQS